MVKSDCIDLAWNIPAELYTLHRIDFAAEGLEFIDCILAHNKCFGPTAAQVNGCLGCANGNAE